MTELEEQVRALVEQDWTVQIQRGEDGYVATVTELPGCVTAAQRWDDLDAMISEAVAAWIESALHHGDPVTSILAAGNRPASRAARLSRFT